MTTRILIIGGALTLCVAGLIALSANAPARQPVTPATLVVTNARIVTVEDAQPEAQAIAIGGDRIVALGTSAEIRRYVGPSTRVIDAQGQLVTPGFIEGHGHFTGVGEAQLNLNLMNVTSWDAIVAMVAEAVKTAKPGQWIVGRGWHQEKWTSAPTPNVEGFPTHASLDRVSPDNPVVLTHASGHASFVNGKAMELSEITKATNNPAGGEVLKDATGEPTGLLRETAEQLIHQTPPSGGAAGARPQGARARGSRSALQGDHQLPGRGLLVRHHRSDEDDGR